jgi:hypothetical protein
MRYPHDFLTGPQRKCDIKLQTICSPFQVAKRTNAIHVGIVQKRGLDETGGNRCGKVGLTREEGGKGEGDRNG